MGLARAWHDDAVTAAEKAAIEARLGDITRRLAALEAAGFEVVKVTGARAGVLAAAVLYANEHVVGYCDADPTMHAVNITAKEYQRAVKELDDLGFVASYGNANHASGYAGVSATPATFVALVGQVVPGVVVERELAAILDVFTRADNDEWVQRADFEALEIPTPRAQHLLEHLETEGLLELHGPGTSADALMFLQAGLLSRGRRVLRGDEAL